MTFATFTSIGLPIALALIMFSMGLSLQLAHFSTLLKQPRSVLIGLFGQLICVPLIALLIIQITGLSGALAVGLMVLSFSPGGTTSNLFSYLAKGDLALSISLTTLAGLITPVSLPLLTTWVLSWQSIDLQDFNFPVGLTIFRLVMVMLLPLALGMLVKRYIATAAHFALLIVKPLSICLFAAVIMAMLLQHWGVLDSWFSQIGIPVISMIFLALLLGWGLARLAQLKLAQRKTICIEVGMQNGGTALLLTQGVFNDPQMSCVPLLYGLLMLLPILFLVWTGRREPSSLC